MTIKTANPVGVREDGCHRNVWRYSQKLMEVGKTIHGQSGRAKAKKRVDKLYRRTGYIHAVTVQLLLTLSSTVLRARLINAYTEFNSLGVNHLN